MNKFTFVFLPKAEDIINYNYVMQNYIIKSRMSYLIPIIIYVMAIANAVVYRNYPWAISLSMMMVAVPTFWIIYDSVLKNRTHTVTTIDKLSKDKVMAASTTVKISGTKILYSSIYEEYNLDFNDINHCYVSSDVIVFQEGINNFLYIPVRAISECEKDDVIQYIKGQMGERLIFVNTH